jgi:LytR cell envelope-related transcriptional attenuator
MSMLTPPGMGGKYRITGNAYPRMRRPSNRRRIVLSAAAGVVVLGLIGWGTAQLVDVFDGSDSHRTSAAGHCAATAVGTRASVAPVRLPKPSAVTVNVYNATQRTGLAQSTATELKKRGFTIGKIGNASDAYEEKVKGTAILLGGPQAQGALKVLGTQLSAGDLKTDPKRAGATNIDLIIGAGFAALDPAQNATHALTALMQPVPTPSGKDCAVRQTAAS